MMILVVDDDPRIRTTTAKLLEDEGYKVVSCDGGAAALKVLQDTSAITFILSDVLMPEMNGTELVARATTLRPDLSILFMSGDVGNTPRSEFAGHDVLTKPFTAVELLAAIARTNELRL